MDRKTLELLANMRAAIAIRDAQVMANPMPALMAAERALSECKQCFDDLRYALSPDFVFDTAEEMGVKPIDFEGANTVKVQKALAVLDKYDTGGYRAKD